MFLLGDMLARVQNGLLLRRHSVYVQRSRLIVEVLKVLYKDGFINGFAIFEENCNLIVVFLKYVDNKPVFQKFKLLSSPSRRNYISARRLLQFISKDGIFVLSTSNYGVISTISIANHSQKTIGGELLFQIIL